MKAFETNKKIWSDIYKSGSSNLSYPNENLVRYIYYLSRGKNIQATKLLDYGFGSGNNLLHLLKMGFDIHGVEVNHYAREMTLNKLNQSNNVLEEDRLIIMEKNGILPYPDNYFDIVLPWLVIHYNSLIDLKKVLKTFHRILKPGGDLLTTMIRKEDIGVQHSIPHSKYERIMTSEIGVQENSVITVLPTEEDIKDVFGMFEILDIGYIETKINQTVGSHWIIYGKKAND